MVNEEGLKNIIQEQIISALDLSKYDLSSDSILSIYKVVKERLDEKIIQEHIIADRKKRDSVQLSEQEEQMLVSIIEEARRNNGEIVTLSLIPQNVLDELNRRISMDPNLLKGDTSNLRRN